jgi:HIV-1 Vpr-binding protein
MSVNPPFGGPDGRRFDRRLIYSRFRPVKTFRGNSEQDEQYHTFTSCAIMPDNDFLLVGTYVGDVKMVDINTMQEVSTYKCHDSQVNHIIPNRNGSLILTSSQWRTPYSCLWSMGEFFDSKIQFPDEDYVEFSNVAQDKVIGTHGEIASIWDIEHSKITRIFKPQISNNYQKNKATFDPTDALILNDGVLFDIRMEKEIRKLDKLNEMLNGVFHPNGLEIISNTEIWDIRTFNILKTVPGFNQCYVKFTNSCESIYAVALEQETDIGENYESAFRTFDASDYSNIATIETKRAILDLAISVNDLQIAVVENNRSNATTTDESVVRLYDVGRNRAEEDEQDDEHDEEDAEDEEDIVDGLGIDAEEETKEEEAEKEEQVNEEEIDPSLTKIGGQELLDKIKGMRGVRYFTELPEESFAYRQNVCKWTGKSYGKKAGTNAKAGEKRKNENSRDDNKKAKTNSATPKKEWNSRTNSRRGRQVKMEAPQQPATQSIYRAQPGPQVYQAPPVYQQPQAAYYGQPQVQQYPQYQYPGQPQQYQAPQPTWRNQGRQY